MRKFIKKPYSHSEYNRLIEIYNKRLREDYDKECDYQLGIEFYSLHTQILKRLFNGDNKRFNIFVNGFGDYIDTGIKFNIQSVYDYMIAYNIDFVERVKKIYKEEESLYKTLNWEYILKTILKEDVKEYLNDGFYSIRDAGRFLLGYCDINEPLEVNSCLAFLFYHMFKQIKYVMEIGG